MEAPEKIWHLIAKSLNRELPFSEQQELKARLEADPELSQQYELLTRIWREKPEDLNDAGRTELAISKIIGKANAGSSHTGTDEGNRLTGADGPGLASVGASDLGDEELYPGSAQLRPLRPRRFRRLLKISVAAAIAVTAGWWFFASGTASPNAVAQAGRAEQLLTTQKGSRSRYLLPDGTTVWLNAGSKLSYENDFTGSTREVRLEGEAYFDVVKQERKPFIVHASGYKILVLGTVFNVKAYPEDKNLETTLYHGSVKVFRGKAEEPTAIQLRPNQKLVIPLAGNETGHVAVKTAGKPVPAFDIVPIDTTKKDNERFETAWLYSRLEFRGDDFEMLSHKLERWYNISISFSDEAVKELHFNGSFEKETAEQAFMAMKAAVPLFNYSIRNHEVTISSLGSK